MSIKNFINSEKGIILLSIIWGLGLSAIFRKVCKGRNCIVIKGVNPKNIKDKIFKIDDKCVKFYPEISSCS